MKQFKRILSLALSCILLAGLICTASAAEGDIGVWVDAIVDLTANDVSQGAVSEESGQVFLTHTYGTVNTLTSAHLGGTVTIPDVDGEAVTLKTIVAEPGCVGYATTEDGRVYTEEDMEQDDDLAYADLGMLFCHYYDVHRDGAIVDGGLSDNDLLGNAHSRFGLYEYPNNDIAMVLFTFFADDGQYWVTTQEALDKFAQLTGIKAVETVFSDVAPDAYYAQAVEWAVDNGVTNGTGNNAFSPNATVTRAEAVTFLWRAAGSPKPNTRTSPFTDVTDSGAWYYQAVLWATEKKITNGVSATQFSLKTTLAYDQMLAFLCRAAGGGASGSDWSNKAVSWAKKNGLTNGISFSNKKDCPRSDVVYFLWIQSNRAEQPQKGMSDEEGARAAIINGFLEGATQITVSSYNVESSALMEMAEKIADRNGANPYQIASLSSGQKKGSQALSLQVTYQPKTQGNTTTDQTDAEIRKLADAVVKEVVTPGMDDYQTAKALHDWLVLNCKYDMRLYSGNMPDISYTAYGPLKYGTSVCAGYAKAYLALLESAGMEAEYVTGDTDRGGHAWNIVKVDGEWYHVDVTWDDPTPDRAGYIRYNYFLRSDKALDRHFDWTAGHACTSTKYDNTTLPNTQEQHWLDQQQEGLELAKEVVAFCVDALKDMPYSTQAELQAYEGLSYDDRIYTIHFPTERFEHDKMYFALDSAKEQMTQILAQNYPGCEIDYFSAELLRIKRNDVDAELQRRRELKKEEQAAVSAEIQARLEQAIRNGSCQTYEITLDGYSDETIKLACKNMTTDGYSFGSYTYSKNYFQSDYTLSAGSGGVVRITNHKWANAETQRYVDQLEAGIRNGENKISLQPGDYPDKDRDYYAFIAVDRVIKDGYTTADGLTAGTDYEVDSKGSDLQDVVTVLIRYLNVPDLDPDVALEYYIHQLEDAIRKGKTEVFLKYNNNEDASYAMEACRIVSDGYSFDNGSFTDGKDFSLSTYGREHYRAVRVTIKYPLEG